MAKTTVVIGMLGTTLDRGGKGKKRWERWRPTVDLCQHD
ncbi:MAG: RNA repair transcriptional activator RtcR family protein, partial [Myxococcota bacterium]